MSHNILNYDSIVATEPTWHRFETLKSRINFSNSGLDWKAVERPLFFEHNDSNHFVENQKIIIREDKALPLSIFTDSYEIIQNERIFECLQESLTGMNYEITCCGSLGNCRKIFISVRLLGEQEFCVNSDKFQNNITFINSFDGSLTFRVFDTSIRVVCQNTLSAALKNRNGMIDLSVKHTKNSNAKITNMEKIIENMFEKRAEFYADLNKLAEIEIAPIDAKKIVTGFIAPTGNILSTRTKNTANAIINKYIFGIGNSGKTCYDLLNGFTEHFSRTENPKKIAKTIGSSMMGANAIAKAQFFETLKNPELFGKCLSRGQELIEAN